MMLLERKNIWLCRGKAVPDLEINRTQSHAYVDKRDDFIKDMTRLIDTVKDCEIMLPDTTATGGYKE